MMNTVLEESLYHVSQKDIKHFEPLTHFYSREGAIANAYLSWVNDGDEVDDNGDSLPYYIYKVKVYPGNSVEIADGIGYHDAQSNLEDVYHGKHISDQEYKEAKDIMDSLPYEEHKHVVANLLRNKNIHSLKYKNTYEDVGHISYIITHPSQVKILEKHPLSLRELQNGEYYVGGEEGDDSWRTPAV